MMTGPRRPVPTEFQIHDRWCNVCHKQLATGDPNEDYGMLWVAVHDYLVCQGRQALGDDANGMQLAQAYAKLVEAHNMIHKRYVAEPTPIAVAGT